MSDHRRRSNGPRRGRLPTNSNSTDRMSRTRSRSVSDESSIASFNEDICGMQQYEAGIQYTQEELDLANARAVANRNAAANSSQDGRYSPMDDGVRSNHGTLPSMASPRRQSASNIPPSSAQIQELYMANLAMADYIQELEWRTAAPTAAARSPVPQRGYLDDSASFHSRDSYHSYHSQPAYHSPDMIPRGHVNVHPMVGDDVAIPRNGLRGSNHSRYSVRSSIPEGIAHNMSAIDPDLRSLGSMSSRSATRVAPVSQAPSSLLTPTRTRPSLGSTQRPQSTRSGDWNRFASPPQSASGRPRRFRSMYGQPGDVQLPCIPFMDPANDPAPPRQRPVTMTRPHRRYSTSAMMGGGGVAFNGARGTPHEPPRFYSQQQRPLPSSLHFNSPLHPLQQPQQQIPSIYHPGGSVRNDIDSSSFHVPSSVIVDPTTDELWCTGEVTEGQTLIPSDSSTLPTRPYRPAISVQARSPGTARTSCSESVISDQRSAKTQYNDPIDDYVREEDPPGSRLWKSLAVGMTCIIPDKIIPREKPSAKLAWREKVAICLIVFFISAAIVGGIGFLPIFLCRSSDQFTQREINNQRGKAWVTIFGTIYDVRNYIKRHPGGSQQISDFLGQDASDLFPRPPPSALPTFCLDTAKNSSLASEVSCPNLADREDGDKLLCHTSMVGPEGVRAVMKGYRTADMVVAPWKLGEDEEMSYVVLDSSIYDVSGYIDGLRDENTLVINPEHTHENAFLFEDLHKLILNKLNEDATPLYNDLFKTNDFKTCLDMMFYHSQVDTRHDPVCAKIGIAMYFLLILVTSMMLIQVLCSLLYLAARHPQFTADDKSSPVMIMVPCYNETDAELSKTIDSVLNNEYPEENKVLVVVADGVVTGSGAAANTPTILGQLLGFEFDCNDVAYEYKSLGKVTANYISVYPGVYETKINNTTKRLKYMVLVKQGSHKERGKGRAGNRGKRDSQLVIQGILNRLQHNREPHELDVVVKEELNRLEIPLDTIEYMMAIDADTRVHHMAMQHMVYHLRNNENILACCGETQVDNKAQSWVTMMQVFEYFSSHHMKKAFESVFGCVTCLPGCFTMYRLFNKDKKPFISSDIIVQKYSRNDIASLHEKNLYELGEDRMLTTLLLQHFPGMRLSFVPEAVCWTIVPHTFSILLSQRRRWINSTLHNMFELLKVETMCGICCVSMKTVVIADLLATMILPASIAYLGYLAYLFSTQPESVDTFVIYFYVLTIILMMVPFLIRTRWDYFFWFIMYVIFGIPTFYFVLPLYSFIHMDDFSWGKTRELADKAKDKDEEKDKDKDEHGDKEEAEDEGKEKEKEAQVKDSIVEKDPTQRQGMNDAKAADANSKTKKRSDDLGDATTHSLPEKPVLKAKVKDNTRRRGGIRHIDSGITGTTFSASHEQEEGTANIREDRFEATNFGGQSADRSLAATSHGSTSILTSSMSHSTSRESERVIAETVSIETRSGELLIYFKAPDEEKQPYLESLMRELECNGELLADYGIDDILARLDPSNPDRPLPADPDDPIHGGHWYVLVHQLKSPHEKGPTFRRWYARRMCELMDVLSESEGMGFLGFRVGYDCSASSGELRPLGDVIGLSDVLFHIMSTSPTMKLDKLAMDRDTIALYFGEEHVEEARAAILGMDAAVEDSNHNRTYKTDGDTVGLEDANDDSDDDERSDATEDDSVNSLPQV